MKTVLLTLEYPSRASYYQDWRDAFVASPDFDCAVHNIFSGKGRAAARRAVADADLTVVLHSCNADGLFYVRKMTTALQGRRGKLLSFIGNELNMPWARMADKIAWLRDVRADFAATQLLQEAGDWLYGQVAGQVLAVPHALNPDAFPPGMPMAARPVMIGGRSYRYSAFLGDDDRNRLFDFFRDKVFDPPLATDLSHEHRFDRAGWAAFLGRCRAVIATEAGSFFTDPDDALVLQIQDDLRARQGGGGGLTLRADSPLHRLAQHLPYGAKAFLRRVLKGGPVRHEALDAEQIDFADIQARFFAGRPRSPVYTKAISSRHFDAIGCGAVQIMFPGRYNDILRADEHYLALDFDFGNCGEVVRRLRDAGECTRIADNARALVLSGHTYAYRMRQVAAAVKDSQPAALRA